VIVLACLVGCIPKEEKLTVDPAKGYIDAKTTLLQAADDRDPATRLHAIEALARTVREEAGAIFSQGLTDENPAVRFAAALAIGDVRHKPSLPTLLKMAGDKEVEPDKRVYCAVIYALFRLGDDSHAGDLAKLLFDTEREVRMDAALAMGKIGEPSAMGPLRTLLANERDEGVKAQLVESLALLGDTRSAQVIEAYTKGYFLDLRLMAIPALGRAGGVRAPRVLRDLIHVRHPVRVRVAAAGELARLGHFDRGAYELCLASIRDPEKVLRDAAKRSRRLTDTDAASLKRLAAISLGWMKRDMAANVLYPLLKDADGGVRAAAAMSMLRLLKPYRPVAPEVKEPATRPAAAKAKPAPAPKRAKLHTAGGRD